MKKIYFLLLSLVLPAAVAGCTGNHDTAEEHAEHDEHGEATEVELSETQLETVGIRLGGIERKEMSELIAATGQLAVNPTDEAVVTPLLPGVVTKICVTEGQTIRKGETVAIIEAPEIAGLSREYLLAREQVKSATLELERQNSLAAAGAGVRKNLTAAQTALQMAEISLDGIAASLRQYGVNPASIANGKNATSVAVKAEISGTVTKVTGRTGSFADMQNPVATIVNNAAIYCSLNIYEKDLSKVKPGLNVEIKLVNNPETTLSGVVDRINGTIDPAMKSIPVNVRIESDTALTLLPGMAVSATIETGDETVDAVPEEAVVSAGGKNYIFLLEDIHDKEGVKNYHFEKLEVVCGTRARGFVEIKPLEPLPADCRIVTANAFYLNSMTSDHGEHSH